MNPSTPLAFWNDLDDSYQPYFLDLAIFHPIQNDFLLEHLQALGKVIYHQAS
jgi:uncharacterized protein